jgi:hypothetical protein
LEIEFLVLLFLFIFYLFFIYFYLFFIYFLFYFFFKKGNAIVQNNYFVGTITRSGTPIYPIIGGGSSSNNGNSVSSNYWDSNGKKKKKFFIYLKFIFIILNNFILKQVFSGGSAFINSKSLSTSDFTSGKNSFFKGWTTPPWCFPAGVYPQLCSNAYIISISLTLFLFVLFLQI